jgi:uncharacterized membrane protein
MHTLRRTIISLLFIVTILIAGCGTRVSQDVYSTTKGQELRDLDNARQQGLITEKEYNKQKKKILKRQ